MHIPPGFDWYAWVILPFIVFFARIADVTLGTLRIVFTSRGKRNIAPVLGFFEVFIWIVAISQIVQNLHSVTAFFGYAAGFATGTYIGLGIEERLAMGTLVLRIVLPKEGDQLAKALHEAGYGVTRVRGEGANGPVKILYTIVKRRDYAEVVEIIQRINPKAFFSAEEVRSTQAGVFPIRLQSRDGILGRIAK